jgi:hypothetical protein
MFVVGFVSIRLCLADIHSKDTWILDLSRTLGNNNRRLILEIARFLSSATRSRSFGFLSWASCSSWSLEDSRFVVLGLLRR